MVFTTPDVFNQHFDSALGNGALVFHQDIANPVNQVVLSSFGKPFNLASFDLTLAGGFCIASAFPFLTITASDGNQVVTAANTLGTVNLNFNDITSVTIVPDPNSLNNACMDNYVFDDLIGGEYTILDTSALLLAGVQTNLAWIIPVLSVAGIGLFVVSRKKF